MRLKKGREHNLFTECRRILIDRKAGSVGRDLEQDAVRLADVQAAEPEAIHLAAVRNVERIQPLGPGVIVLVGSAEGNVVDSAGALTSHLQVRLHRDVQLRVRPATPHLEDMHASARVVGIRYVPHLSHVEDFGQQRVGGIQGRNADDDRTETANLVLWWNGTERPRRWRIASPTVVYQCESLAFGILELQREAAVSFGDVIVRYLRIVKSLGPPVQ